MDFETLEYVDYVQVAGGYVFTLKDGKKVRVEWGLIQMPRKGKLKFLSFKGRSDTDE